MLQATRWSNNTLPTKTCLEKFLPQFKPVTFKGYVDNFFQNINQIEKFKNCFNLQHANIKFNFEIEKNNSLALLDLKIILRKQKNHYLVYRKLTFSGFLNNFESFIPNSYKYSLIVPLLHRAFKLCSNFESFQQEIENLRSFLERMTTWLALFYFAWRNTQINCMLEKYFCLPLKNG